MAHRLLIVSSQCGEDISHGVQRFAECGHVAVPEYGPDAGEQSAALAINFGPLRRHGANQSLRDGEPTCRQFLLLSGRSSRGSPADDHASTSALKRPAMSSMVASSDICPESHACAALANMVRPTAKPRTIGLAAAAVSERVSSSIG